MSRKNRSKFIAFPLNNNQICKEVFVQHDESTSRQIDAHQPPASHHRHGLDSPAPTTPKAGTQAQHIAGQHQRTAAPKRKDRGRQQHQSPRPTPRRERKQGKGETSGQRLHTEPAQEDTASRRPEDSQPQPMKPPARQQSQHHPGHRTSQTGGRGKRGEKGEGKRNGQKMTV